MDIPGQVEVHSLSGAVAYTMDFTRLTTVSDVRAAMLDAGIESIPSAQFLIASSPVLDDLVLFELSKDSASPCVILQMVKLASIRFDGYYIMPVSMGTRYFLRFYEEGNVVKSMIASDSVSVGEEHMVEQDIKHGYCGTGVYELSGDIMSFSTTRWGDTEKYNGRVLSPSELELSSGSIVNGIYTFVAAAAS